MQRAPATPVAPFAPRVAERETDVRRGDGATLVYPWTVQFSSLGSGSRKISRSHAVGTTFRLPNRKVGISPRFAASYDALRESPIALPANGTVVVGFVRISSSQFGMLGVPALPITQNQASTGRELTEAKLRNRLRISTGWLTLPRRTELTKSGMGKRYPLNMRTTKEVRDKLEHAAAATGRSLAQEVELRLEKSFLIQDLMAQGLELSYGSKLAAVLLMLGEGMKMTANMPDDSGRDWFDDPYSFDQVVRCSNRIFSALRPPGELPEVSVLDLHLGDGFARTILDEAASGRSKSGFRPAQAKLIRDLLGPLARRIKQGAVPAE
jgi:hypothetical protein